MPQRCYDYSLFDKKGEETVDISKTPIVLMTDFGTSDGAVSAMKGVIYSVDAAATVVDLTHNIEPFNIHEASFRLFQVLQYYPKGTVFVCVVDPGVGTNRKSIVAKTHNDYYIVTPDNGILTYVADHYGIDAVREIDESQNRLPSSINSHTFHGRDVYAYTGARLATGKIDFEGVGDTALNQFTTISIQVPSVVDGSIHGTVVALDGVYGNLWTNVTEKMLTKIGITYGQIIQIDIVVHNALCYQATLLFGKTFGESEIGQPIAYMNSIGHVAIAVNQGNFAKKFQIKPGYNIHIRTGPQPTLG